MSERVCWDSEAHGRTEAGTGYEIRLAGRLGPALQRAFPGMRARVEPRHSVLVLGAQPPDELASVLALLRAHGLEVTAARLGTATRNG